MLSFSIGGTFLLGFVMNEQKTKLSDQALLVAKTVQFVLRIIQLRLYLFNVESLDIVLPFNIL